MATAVLKAPEEALQEWLGRLERQYVQLALEVAHYESRHEPGSPHDDYAQLDRLEADMARARKALELCRTHAKARGP